MLYVFPQDTFKTCVFKTFWSQEINLRIKTSVTCSHFKEKQWIYSFPVGQRKVRFQAFSSAVCRVDHQHFLLFVN